MTQCKRIFIVFVWLVVLSQNHVNAGGTYYMTVGQTKTLSFSTSKVINSASWYSASSSIVQVTSHGVTTAQIKAIKSYPQYVIVRCDYYYWITSGTYRYLAAGFEDFDIYVNAINPTNISIPANLTINYGYNTTITPTLTPSNAETTLTWSSNNTSVATVNSSGKVAAINPGTAYITVKTANGLTSTSKIFVPEPSFTLKEIIPANNAQSVPENTVISANYSLPVFQGAKFADISLFNIDTNLQTAGTLSINSSKLIFTPVQLLSPNTNYKFIIPSSAMKNQWGTEYSTAVEINFKTAVTTTTATNEIQTNLLSIYANDHILHIKQLTVGMILRIYNAMGVIVYNGIATDDKMDIPLREQGVYYVQTMNKTVKVIFSNL
jgi:hypothetical protein